MDFSTLESRGVPPRVSNSKKSYMSAHPESGSISPLPSDLRSGLIAISITSALSFAFTFALWSYLTYKFISWRLRWHSRAKKIVGNLPEPATMSNLDFVADPSSSSAAAAAAAAQGHSAKEIHERNVEQIRNVKNEGPNQFLVLIYNLLIADMHQATAFVISATWLRRNGIFINTAACFVQGFFDSNGDLASSCFITFIATHTYLSVVKGYQPPQRHVYIAIVAIWVFVYSLSIIPLLITKNGHSVGGYFVRAGGWCWISKGYENLRLLTHYLFIFLALAITSTLYISIYLALRRESRAKARWSNVELSHRPIFLIYPLIYVTCTLPLALGRIATMAGASVPIGYYCFAGAMIASNGFFDCLIFGRTRYAIVFGSVEEVNAKNTGLDTFSFMRTPAKDYGNEVWIEGGTQNKKKNNAWQGVGGWWQSRKDENSGKSAAKSAGARGNSEESLRGVEQNDMAIHMDVVTSMTVVEADQNRRRYPDSTMSDIIDDGSSVLKSDSV